MGFYLVVGSFPLHTSYGRTATFVILYWPSEVLVAIKASSYSIVTSTPRPPHSHHFKFISIASGRHGILMPALSEHRPPHVTSMPITAPFEMAFMRSTLTTWWFYFSQNPQNVGRGFCQGTNQNSWTSPCILAVQISPPIQRCLFVGVQAHTRAASHTRDTSLSIVIPTLLCSESGAFIVPLLYAFVMTNQNLEVPGSMRHRRNRTASLTICSTDQRWSDVVPPNSALTFAVIWDPDDDLVVFSGADLLDSIDNPNTTLDSPIDVGDSYSQVLTIGHSTIPLSENTATLAFFRDHHEFLFSTHTPLSFDRLKLGRSQTSSTLEGFDVYLRGSMFGKANKPYRRYSFLGNLEDDFKFNPTTSFANLYAKQFSEDQSSVTDEGYSEGIIGVSKGNPQDDEANLCSAFSVTTTSTSNYISVELDDDDDEGSASWSTLEAPGTPGYSRLLFSEQQRRSSRRLRKRRPTASDIPASPSIVLQRPCYNHTMSSDTRCSKHVVLPKFIRSLSMRRCKSRSMKAT
ncbi:hypothetical protein Hypma_004585 [Hypsizygus marmoreus]|uniref:Uncharacterized protein n=1 Tax=Hypsizygus marmoreus TaxID=39966 RepID=A0A369K5P9_HYPMA|nr:hypothetical protein Hypma_004585 [Hypsizygus marmoreus]